MNRMNSVIRCEVLLWAAVQILELAEGDGIRE